MKIEVKIAGLHTPRGLEAAINVVGLTPEGATNTKGEIVVDETRGHYVQCSKTHKERV